MNWNLLTEKGKLMPNNGVDIRYDSTSNEFVLNLAIPGLRDFEIRDTILSRAFLNLSEELENEEL